ncbi:hypothetical protein [Litorimonas cladophorae]|uniref:hypothetical protein n=1 Tax=Litorimonas cladophorae TaxID=1220491 RepID=UPI00167B0C8F|nr:hypothetical protein [Litorimonas cladophorae]
MKNFSITTLALITLLTACGKDGGAENQKVSGAQNLPKHSQMQLSTAPIQIIKTELGVFADGFESCVFSDEALVSLFNLPADTHVSQRQKDRRCFYTLQRQEPENSGPYANFYASIAVIFDGYAPKNDTELAAFTNLHKTPALLSGFTEKTYSVTTSSNADNQIIGFPPGGSYYLTLRSSGVRQGQNGPLVSRVYKLDQTQFRKLAQNLNARLQTPPLTQ